MATHTKTCMPCYYIAHLLRLSGAMFPVCVCVCVEYSLAPSAKEYCSWDIYTNCTHVTVFTLIENTVPVYSCLSIYYITHHLDL